MVLCGQHNILCTGRLEQICPCLRIEPFSLEVLPELIIAVICAIGLLMVLMYFLGAGGYISVGFLLVKPKLVPFGIAAFGRPGRYGVSAPVDEDPEFGIFVPAGDCSPVEVRKGDGVFRLTGPGGRQRDEQECGDDRFHSFQR